jgi:hypothetical protein
MACHHPNAGNQGAWARSLVFFHLFSFGFTPNFFLQLGILVIIFRRHLALVVA